MEQAQATEDRADHNLMIDLGCEILLQFDSSGAQVQGRLIGLEKDYFIIVRPRPLSGFGSRAVKGDQAQALYLCDGTVFAFRSTLIHFTQTPLPLFFLSFPTRVQTRPLRNRTRAPAFLPASARIRNRAWPGVLLDLSREGLRFACPPSLDGIPLRAEINDKIEITLGRLLTGPPLILDGKIKTIDESGGFPAFGVNLARLPAEGETVIGSYLDRVRFLGRSV